MVHFDTDAALKQLQHERVTFAYPTFPTITQDIVHSPGSASADLSRIRGVLDTAPPEVLADIQRAFPQAKVVSSYGLTEAGGVVTYGHLDDPPERRFATAGRPFDGMSVRIVDPETGTQLGPMEPGEIRVAGVGMFEGYLNDSTHAAAQTDEQGYLKTGDLGYLDDDGRIAYTGRLKDMLKVAGENVAAAEVEAHLASHPAVKIAQVVGAPDRRLIEVPVAFVELVDGHEATEQELITHCRTALASFKVPRHVKFVRRWPMSATKIQKFRLREAVSAAGECASASSLAARINTQ
jgi:acyl-CoA synthetase (AMP-forming)/AMP-acid ligase II